MSTNEWFDPWDRECCLWTSNIPFKVITRKNIFFKYSLYHCLPNWLRTVLKLAEYVRRVFLFVLYPLFLYYLPFSNEIYFIRIIHKKRTRLMVDCGLQLQNSNFTTSSGRFAPTSHSCFIEESQFMYTLLHFGHEWGTFMLTSEMFLVITPIQSSFYIKWTFQFNICGCCQSRWYRRLERYLKHLSHDLHWSWLDTLLWWRNEWTYK